MGLHCTVTVVFVALVNCMIIEFGLFLVLNQPTITAHIPQKHTLKSIVFIINVFKTQRKTPIELCSIDKLPGIQYALSDVQYHVITP